MALVIEKSPAAGRIIAAERIWLTADGKNAVPEGHPDAASLLAAKGHSIPRAEAERLGLLKTATNEEAQAMIDAGEAKTPEEAEMTPAGEAQVDEAEATEAEEAEEEEKPAKKGATESPMRALRQKATRAK